MSEADGNTRRHTSSSWVSSSLRAATSLRAGRLDSERPRTRASRSTLPFVLIGSRSSGASAADHVMRQPRGQPALEAGQVIARGADDARGQAGVAVAAGHDDDRRGHARVAHERALDLAELHAIASNLDLVIGASGDGDVAVLAPRGDVAGPVHALGGAVGGAERVPQELGGRELRSLDVAGRYAGAGDVDLSGRADPDAVGRGIEDQDLHARRAGRSGRSRPRLRARAVGPSLSGKAAVDGRFGGAVAGQELGVGVEERAEGVHLRIRQMSELTTMYFIGGSEPRCSTR